MLNNLDSSLFNRVMGQKRDLARQLFFQREMGFNLKQWKSDHIIMQPKKKKNLRERIGKILLQTFKNNFTIII